MKITEKKKPLKFNNSKPENCRSQIFSKIRDKKKKLPPAKKFSVSGNFPGKLGCFRPISEMYASSWRARRGLYRGGRSEPSCFGVRAWGSKSPLIDLNQFVRPHERRAKSSFVVLGFIHKEVVLASLKRWLNFYSEISHGFGMYVKAIKSCHVAIFFF